MKFAVVVVLLAVALGIEASGLAWGEQADVHPFINAIRVIQPAIQSLPVLQRYLVAYQIIARLSGKPIRGVLFAREPATFEDAYLHFGAKCYKQNERIPRKYHNQVNQNRVTHLPVQSNLVHPSNFVS
ncbi:unnamed protein product [Hermetia illucens]|uniref:Uncharacterized protein n=1 Tax=Hermetia illucens TaxID=343691 RepID=A0A7R8UEH9_HERIL|nr:unnamed protein product [Hermetia illucens]